MAAKTKEYVLDPKDSEKQANIKTFNKVCLIFAGVPFENGVMVDVNTQPNKDELWHNYWEVRRVFTQSRTKNGVIQKLTMGEADKIIKERKKLPAKLQKLIVPFGTKRPSTKRLPSKKEVTASLRSMSKKEVMELLKALGDE